MRRFTLLLTVMVAGLLFGCSDGDDPDLATSVATSAPTESPTTPRPTATEPPTPAPNPAPIEVESTVWAVDTATHEATLLLQAPDFVVSSSFDEASGRAHIRWRGDEITGELFSLDGRERGPAPIHARCVEQGADALVDGVVVTDTECGAVSPDGRWMLDLRRVGEHTSDSGYTVPIEDYWLIEVATGERSLLQAGLQHCGGCDGRFGLAWSASSRFVTFAEFGGGGRMFLADLESGTSVVLTHGNNLDEAPQWSPRDDVVAIPAEAGDAVLFDPQSGVRTPLPARWPVAWDAGGELLYSPPWGPGESMAVLTPAGEVLAELSGTPSWINLWNDRTPLVATSPRSFVAALEGGADCSGVTVYASGLGSAGSCIAGGTAAVVSPDGRFVAVPIEREHGILASYGAGEYGGVSLTRYDVALVEVATGNATTVVADLISNEPPDLTWSEDGSHLLVRSPATYGI